MTGLLLLATTVVWLAIAASIALFLMRAKPWSPGTNILRAFVFVALVPLPIADEMVGGWQFRRLCKENAVVEVDAEKVRGRIVKLKTIPNPELPGYVTIPRRMIGNTAVPIREDFWQYVDARSGDALFSYKTYEAIGGRAIRT